jgi:hypothetical protein
VIFALTGWGVLIVVLIIVLAFVGFVVILSKVL